MENLEKDVLKVIQRSIAESIEKVLVGYGSPLHKLIEIVISKHSEEIYAIIESAFSTIFRNEEFQTTLRQALSHKLARSLVDKMGGGFEKRINELRSDPIMKARMILAIENILKEK